MANDDHLAILDQGVSVWNNWRLESSEERPNLSLAILSKREFDGFNFDGTNFSGATLTASKFKDIRIRNGILEAADLSNAEFVNSKLQACNLQRATLERAKFVECDLSGANFTDGLLPGASFSGSSLQSVIGIRFDATYLREVQLSPYANDEWSILRRSYSGSRLFFHLVLLMVSMLPYAVQMFGWVSVSIVQDAESILQVQAAKEVERRVANTQFQSELDKVVARLLAMEPCLKSECVERSVLRILLGGVPGEWYHWLLTLCVVLYNAGRGGLIWTVGALRDEEDRSGYTPRRLGAGGYQILMRAHVTVRVLLVGNLVALAFHLVDWLSRIVVVPR